MIGARSSRITGPAARANSAANSGPRRSSIGSFMSPPSASSGRVAAGRSRQAGGGPLEPHRPDGAATIGGDRPLHVVATIPQRPSDRRQGVHVPGAARTRAQHPQPTLHRRDYLANGGSGIVG